MENLGHVSHLVEPVALLEVATHDHLEDEDGDAVEKENPDEDEKGDSSLN